MDGNILLHITALLCMLLIAVGYRYNKPFAMANGATYFVGAILLYIRLNTDRHFPDMICNYINLLFFNALFIAISTVYLVCQLMKNRVVG
ncbi:MAG TPA: hypothetical protein VK167_13005 [Flavipsychrobacter sp.]|nr:hypothetical protein [Flavipsychrobacter sp.]